MAEKSQHTPDVGVNPSPETQRIPLHDIEVGPRLRALNPTVVEELADAIRSIGLQTPITVRRPNDLGVHRIVVGVHRLRAMERLGETHIAARVVDWDDVTCAIWEVRENLDRAELTTLERNEHLAHLVRLIEQKRAQDKPAQDAQVSAKGGRGKTGGESALARDLKLDRRKIERARKIGDLTPEARAAAVEAGLANDQSALLDIAAVPKPQQAAKVAALAEARREGKARTKQEPSGNRRTKPAQPPPPQPEPARSEGQPSTSPSAPPRPPQPGFSNELADDRLKAKVFRILYAAESGPPVGELAGGLRRILEHELVRELLRFDYVRINTPQDWNETMGANFQALDTLLDKEEILGRLAAQWEDDIRDAIRAMVADSKVFIDLLKLVETFIPDEPGDLIALTYECLDPDDRRAQLARREVEKKNRRETEVEWETIAADLEAQTSDPDPSPPSGAAHRDLEQPRAKKAAPQPSEVTPEARTSEATPPPTPAPETTIIRVPSKEEVDRRYAEQQAEMARRQAEQQARRRQKAAERKASRAAQEASPEPSEATPEAGTTEAASQPPPAPEAAPEASGDSNKPSDPISERQEEKGECERQKEDNEKRQDAIDWGYRLLGEKAEVGPDAWPDQLKARYGWSEAQAEPFLQAAREAGREAAERWAAFMGLGLPPVPTEPPIREGGAATVTTWEASRGLTHRPAREWTVEVSGQTGVVINDVTPAGERHRTRVVADGRRFCRIEVDGQVVYDSRVDVPLDHAKWEARRRDEDERKRKRYQETGIWL